MERKLKKGYVQVYTGNGKGKTTAMLGLALRAAGAGCHVYIGQFFKSGDYSEVKAIKNYLPTVDIEQYGDSATLGKVSAQDIAEAKEGVIKAKESMTSGKYDMVLLDEINVALFMDLLALEDVVDLIQSRPDHVELVLTGRYAIQPVIDLADLVSDIGEVKHYYAQGVQSRKGVEL